MMPKYRVKGWSKFQHFKDRKPPWIKLYRDILDDPDWFELDPKNAKVLVMLWLIASEDKEKQGRLPCTKKLAFRLRITETRLVEQLKALKGWVIQYDIKAISGRYQDDTPETETETETETDSLSGKHAQPRVEYAKIIDFLNKTANTNFKPTAQSTKTCIRARSNEGFSLPDFKAVIEYKVDEWGTDEKMVKFIRPQTLFGTKFEGYLQDALKNGVSQAKSTWVTSDAIKNSTTNIPN